MTPFRFAGFSANVAVSAIGTARYVANLNASSQGRPIEARAARCGARERRRVAFCPERIFVPKRHISASPRDDSIAGRATSKTRSMREGVQALERRVGALRDELASRDGMLEAVQAQARADVEDARRARDDAMREARAEKTMRLEAAAMALTALEAKARLERALDEATPRDVERTRALDALDARPKRAEAAARARGEEIGGGRVDAGAVAERGVVRDEGGARGGARARRRRTPARRTGEFFCVESEGVGARAEEAAAAVGAMGAWMTSTSSARAARRRRRRRTALRTTATRRSGRTRAEPPWRGAWRRAKRIRPSSSS